MGLFLAIQSDLITRLDTVTGNINLGCPVRKDIGITINSNNLG